ncbi:MAG: hypothetical protein JWN93_1616 [Hyphomicrobiales bacterium]|jgi:hypothetical protein|nr:hypothetical protein [Hyphomicrobiales bacterium]
MRGRAFETLIGACLNRGRADVEARSAALRRAGLWPSGRGRYAPPIGPEGVAAGLLAHLGAAKPSQAVGACQSFSNLVEQVTLGRRLVKVLANIVADPAQAAGVRMILFNRIGPSAQIVSRDGSSRRFELKAPDAASAPDVAPALAGEAGFLSGELLLRLAQEIAGSPSPQAGEAMMRFAPPREALTAPAG